MQVVKSPQKNTFNDKIIMYNQLFTGENSTSVPPLEQQLLTDNRHRVVVEGDKTPFFTENLVRNEKICEAQQKNAAGENNGRDLLRGRDDGNYYVSSLNTKRNPDLIVPGGLQLRGNLYRRRHLSLSGTNEAIEREEDEEMQQTHQ